MTKDQTLLLIAAIALSGPFASVAIGWILEVLAEIDREREQKQELLRQAPPIATASACPPSGGFGPSWKSTDPRRRERTPEKQAGPSAFGAGSGGRDGGPPGTAGPLMPGASPRAAATPAGAMVGATMAGARRAAARWECEAGGED